jgi:hypothetical protein
MKKIAWLLFLSAAPILFSIAAVAQIGAITNYCNLGAAQAKTSGLQSSNYQQGIIPSCKVTVYLTQTATLATIYADSSETPLTNPFTATTVGQWLFFAAVNQGYDVVLSGGVSPNIYPASVTLTDLYPSTQVIVGTVLWGEIGGTLNNQTDLQAALNAKLSLTGGTMTGNLILPGITITGLTGYLYANGSSAVTASSIIPVAALSYDYTTVNGQICALGSTCTIPSSAANITVGTTTVTNGTSNYILYDNSGVLGNLAIIPNSAGGTGVNTAASTGVPVIASGSWGIYNTACSGAGYALNYSTGALSCNSAINAATLETYTWETPKAIGSTTPNTGAFTQVSVGGLISGNYVLAGPQSTVTTGWIFDWTSPTTTATSILSQYSGCLEVTSGVISGTGSACGSGSGGVTSFSAPSASWPSWLVPTVTNSTTTPSLAVTASVIPNSALANSATTVNGQTCTLGSSCTVTTVASLTVGTTTVTSGTSGYILYDNAGVLGNLATTGNGYVVLSSSPSISSPTVTSSFTATGLVTNADLVNSSTTVNSVTCTLGGTCTVTAASLKYQYVFPSSQALGGVTSGTNCQTIDTSTTTSITSPVVVASWGNLAGISLDVIITAGVDNSGTVVLDFCNVLSGSTTIPSSVPVNYAIF